MDEGESKLWEELLDQAVDALLDWHTPDYEPKDGKGWAHHARSFVAYYLQGKHNPKVGAGD